MEIIEAGSRHLSAARDVARLSLHLDEPEAADLVTLLWDRPDAVALVARDDGIVGVAMGSIDDGGGHVDLIAVLPDQRRQGHGSALLARLEQELLGRGAEELWIGGTSDRYAWPGIDVRYTPALCLARSAGYVPAHDAESMTVDLTVAPLDTTAPEGVEVRRLDPGERTEFALWMQATWSGSWPAEAMRAAAFSVPRVHVALADGRYLGFACHGANRPSWFGPMGTVEAARGRGIGRVLLRHCLADQHAAGISRAEISWVGPVCFYSDAVGAYLDRICRILRREV